MACGWTHSRLGWSPEPHCHLPVQEAHSTCPHLPRCHYTRSAASEAGATEQGRQPDAGPWRCPHQPRRTKARLTVAELLRGPLALASLPSMTKPEVGELASPMGLSATFWQFTYSLTLECPTATCTCRCHRVSTCLGCQARARTGGARVAHLGPGQGPDPTHIPCGFQGNSQCRCLPRRRAGVHFHPN